MTSGSTNRKSAGVRVLWLLVPVLVLNMTACSTAYRYRLLSFFFDGVPEPAKIAAIHPADTLSNKDTVIIAGKTAAEPIINLHMPYQKKDCTACHDQNTTGKQIKPMPDLCYQCHEDFATRYKVLHGPVGGGQCTACHNPHLSSNKNLLIRKNQDVCLYCHESERIMKSDAHLGIKDILCTECHDPHGGEDRYVLK